jgi:hypothetical protein
LHQKLRSSSKHTLLDCVPERQLRQWVPKCSKELDMFKERLQQGIELSKSIEKAVANENISSPIVNHKQLSEYIKQAAVSVQNQKEIVDKIQNDYNDIITRRKNTQLSVLVSTHEQNLKQMRGNDKSLQAMLNSCLESKFNLTNELLDRLRSISMIQYNIKRLSRKISVYIPILKSIISKFAHLELIHYFPGAYSLSLVEILRRRNFLRKYSGEIAKATNRLNVMRDEELSNRQQFDKLFGRYLPPGLIPGLTEKLPSYNLASSGQYHNSFLDTSLPSIDTPQEINFLDMEAIRQLCGSAQLGQGVLKMYATTLDENDIFHQMEFSSMVETATDELSPMYKQQHGDFGSDYSLSGHFKTSGGSMFNSRSSTQSFGGGGIGVSINPSYTSDVESHSPLPSPTNSPRSLSSSEQLQKITHSYKAQIEDRDAKIEKYEQELANLENQLISTRHSTSSNTTTTTTIHPEQYQFLVKENERLKETVALKERLRHDMAQNCDKAVRESQKLTQQISQYNTALQQMAEGLLSKVSDENARNQLHTIISQLYQEKNVNLDDLVRIVLQINR